MMLRPEFNITLLLCWFALPGVSTGQMNGPLTGPAMDLLNSRASAVRKSFVIFQSRDSALNHGSPSGRIGDPLKTLVDTGAVGFATVVDGCADGSTFDPNSNVLSVTFAPLKPPASNGANSEIAGMYFEEPEGFDVLHGGGYDLTGATRLKFDAASPPGGMTVTFSAGARKFPPSSVNADWTPFDFDTSDIDLSAVHVLFTVTADGQSVATGGRLLLRNIRYEGNLDRSLAVLGLPLSFDTLSILPARNGLCPGRVPVPLDQVLKNIALTADASWAIGALLTRGTPDDLTNARFILDTLVYALHHDSHGLPLPVAPDEAHGLHSAYMGGEIALVNNQSPPADQPDAPHSLKGDVRLAGFTLEGSALCGPGHFCLVLDGASASANAAAIIALAAGSRQFEAGLVQDQRVYANAAREIGDWIHFNLLDPSPLGYGGYHIGFPDMGIEKRVPLLGKSVSDNAKIFAAFRGLSILDPANAREWNRRAELAGDFVMAMFDDSSGSFNAGTIDINQIAEAAGPGVIPDGPVQGNDVVNIFDYLDSQTMATLALAADPKYSQSIDWSRPAAWFAIESKQANSGDKQYSGFNIAERSTTGPDGIGWEYTAQAVLAMFFAHGDGTPQGFKQQALFYLDQLQQAQQTAPFTDKLGLPAGTLVNPQQSVPTYQTCINVPFQCIPERVSLAATAWAIFADRSVNPLYPGIQLSR